MFSILYVDDEPGLLEIGKMFLEQGGQFRVETLTSAPEALEILNREQYDAIISDYQMPVMDGIEFLKHVRSSGNTVPFIIFTGRGREEIVIQALNEGADFYLQKGGEPVSQFTELAHKIRQAVLQRRAEASIRDHERREADIINFLPDATFAIDTKGVVIAWNRAMEKMTGVPASEVRGKGNYEYAMPFYHEHRPLLIDLVLRDDPEAVARYPYIKRDNKTLFSEITIPYFNEGRGAVLWFTASPLYDTGGTVVGAIESIREITEWKKAEAALRESERQFRILAENSQDIIGRHTPEGRYTYVSPAIKALCGYDPEELIGHSVTELVHPDDLCLIAEYRKNLSRENPASVVSYRIRHKDGHVVWAETVFRGIYDDGTGDLLEICGITRDITKLKETEEKLRRTTEDLDSRNRLFATLLDTVPIGIFMVEAPSGKPILANREATQLLGRGVLPDATADNLALVYEVYKAGTTCRFPTEEMPVVRGMHGESSRVDDMVVVRPDGSTVRLEVFGTPITNSQGGVVGSLVSFLDITERKRSEQVITEAHSKINLLTSITRHDVANQITVLRGLTKIALMKKPDSVVTGLLEKIDAAVSLIARQIEFTRAYQELGVHAPGWHRVRDIMAQQKTDGVTLSCTCDAEVFADPMLERVFFNLIDNAVRHGEKVTAITISCRQDQNTSLVITVEDNGCGVPPDLKETIFGKGYGRHTGFGLFLAREVLAITGITIRESGTHGNGARFEMVVPKGMYRAAP